MTKEDTALQLDLIEILKVIFLGIVEGITEWLPISSTGHMLLVDEFITLQMSDAFKEMFFVVIQLGAILAVVLLFFHKLWPFSANRARPVRQDVLRLWGKVLVASLPAALIGVPFDDAIDALFYDSPFVIAAALIVYGVLFIVLENRNARDLHRKRLNDLEELSYAQALLIGAFQVLALVPGTSRSGSTILGAMILGLARPAAAEFSFYMSIPVMFGASLLKLLKFGLAFTGTEAGLLLAGMLTAFVVSVLAIKFLMAFVQRHDFKVFGWYRIALGALVIAYFALWA